MVTDISKQLVWCNNWKYLVIVRHFWGPWETNSLRLWAVSSTGWIQTVCYVISGAFPSQQEELHLPVSPKVLSALHSWLSQRALINNQHPNPSTHVDLRSSHWQSCSHTPFKESKTQKFSVSFWQHTFMGSQDVLVVGPRASWPPHVLSGDNKN